MCAMRTRHIYDAKPHARKKRGGALLGQRARLAGLSSLLLLRSRDKRVVPATHGGHLFCRAQRPQSVSSSFSIAAKPATGAWHV